MADSKLHIIGRYTLQKQFMGCSIKMHINQKHSNQYLGEKSELRQLWHQFMSVHYKNIKPYCVDDNITSIEEPAIKNTVRKWAAVEVIAQNQYQNENLSSIVFQGEYFGFTHMGTALQFSQSFIQAMNYLQENDIQIDESKPRFEIMHKNYLPNDSSSQEEFWIPIKNDLLPIN